MSDTSKFVTTDPEILALLDFEPAPRKREVDGGWTPELQREVVARLAVTGSYNLAAGEMGKDPTGLKKVYNSPPAASFRAACDGAVALAKARQAAGVAAHYVQPGSRPPTLDNRRKFRPEHGAMPLPGQRLNERGEWEDADAIARRGEDARWSIIHKLQGARRLYLQEICGSAAKRAAFEILTRLPIDWKKAKRLEPQPDEPWRTPNMREPDMLLTAENGWLAEFTHGPDKKAQMRKAIDDYRKKKGQEPVNWEEEE
jgi:hypothetical protein